MKEINGILQKIGVNFPVPFSLILPLVSYLEQGILLES